MRGLSEEGARGVAEYGSRSTRSGHVLPWTILGLALLECSSGWFGGKLSVYAAWTWIGLCAFAFGVSGFTFLASSIQAIRERAWGWTLSTFGALFLCFWGVQGYEVCAINYESALQLTAGLANMARPDLGHHELAFISYPSRQYTLLATPALLAGPSLLTLRLGYALFFFLGWATFRNGLREWLESSGEDAQKSKDLAGLFAATVLTFPIAVHWIRAFEQTLLPISLTCFAIGFGMEWIARRRVHAFVGLAWALAMLGTTYSPALAVWALGLVILLRCLIQPRLFTRFEALPRLHLCSLLGFALAHGVTNLFLAREAYQASFTVGADADAPSYSAAELWGRIVSGFASILTDQRTPFFHAILWWPIVGLVAWLLITPRLRRDWQTWALVAWCLCSICASLVLRGYVRHEPAFDLHRAMIIIPVLVLGMFAALHALAAKQVRQVRIVATMAFVVTTVWLGTRTKDIWGGERYAPRFNEDLVAAALAATDGKPDGVTIYLAPHLPIGGNLRDYLSFLAPGTQVKYGENFPTDAAAFDRPTLGVFTQDDPTLVALRDGGAQVKPLRSLSQEEVGKEPFVLVSLVRASAIDMASNPARYGVTE